MIFIVILTIFALVQGNDPNQEISNDDKMKEIVSNFIKTIPDPEPKYIMNNGLSKLISKYYGGKIHTFPLYKLTLKIDRNPVKIPWTLGERSSNQNNTKIKVVKVNRPVK